MNVYSALRVMLLVVFSSLVSALFVANNGPHDTTSTTDSQPAFSRVISTQTLRCGYVVYAPGTMRAPQTGKLIGIAHDVVEAAASKLNIRVIWTEETSWGSHLEGLNTGRYDMLCSSSFVLPSDAARAESIGPLYYSGIGVFVRTDDNRFNNNVSLINSPETVIAAIDGTIPAIIAAEKFSSAKLSSHPQFTDYTLNAVDVATGKADVTFVENYYGMDYLARNPGKLKNIAQHKPLRIYHNKLLVNKGEVKLQSMFQNVISEMLNNGELDAIIDAYERYPDALIRVSKPFAVTH